MPVNWQELTFSHHVIALYDKVKFFMGRDKQKMGLILATVCWEQMICPVLST
jgi:hypothetical protein